MPDAPMLAARNPYALAETVIGRPIDWSQVSDRRAFLEQTFQTPYEQLFDPAFGSPVYLGFTLDDHGRVVAAPPTAPAARNKRAPIPADAESDADRYPEIDLSRVRTLADLRALVGGAVEDLPIRRLAPSRASGWTIEVGQIPAMRTATLGRIFTSSVIGRLCDDKVYDFGWTPDGAEWVDTGTFFKEAAEFFDPIQGALADCWLIAAMSAVAWSLPYTFSQRSRATGEAFQQFTNEFQFTDPGTGMKVTYEATDRTLVYTGTTSPLYGRSSEDGEIWPALVEKAYAMWRGNTPNDRPNMTVLNGGDPVHASAALTGRQPHYTDTASATTSQLINLVKSNSSSFRTLNPMTAYTYASGADSPDKVNYADANLVAWHAYTVLGWTSWYHIATATTATNQRGEVRVPVGPIAELDWWPSDYIVLRNPWGYVEATSGTLSGIISMHDVDFWRSIDLADVDGVFAIDVPTFKKYFAGIGVAL
jgi:hypothetical protein